MNNIFEMQAVLEEQGVSKKCVDSAMNDMIECVQDGTTNADDPTAGSSLDIQSGCCTKKCADGINKVKHSATDTNVLVQNGPSLNPTWKDIRSPSGMVLFLSL